MKDLVIVTGDFSTATTALFTVFRQLPSFHCLYEPLHERLLEYLIYPLRADAHHAFVEPYFREYRGFDRAFDLFRPEWGTSMLRLEPDEPADELRRYFHYLIGTSLGLKQRVMIKENRLAFRLGWIRANFPQARIIHIHRDMEQQWRSIVRRVQEYHGREDVGQASVDFAGFSMAAWCEDLKGTYPQLDARKCSSGYERFSRLWQLSFDEHRKYADLSIDQASLTADFDGCCQLIGHCIGYELDASNLRRFIVTPASGAGPPRGGGATRAALRVLDHLGRKYAKAVLFARYQLRGNSAAAWKVIRRDPVTHRVLRPNDPETPRDR